MKDFNWVDFFIQKLRMGIIERYVEKDCYLLDIGCGYYPRNIVGLKNKVGKAVGIDREPPPRSPAKNIRLMKYDINKKLPFKGGTFDCITMLAVLEHLSHPKEIVKECRRVLKKGGKLIVTVPSNYSKPVLETLAYLRIISREEISGHLNYFNIKELNMMQKRAGLKMIKSRYYNLHMNILLVYEK